MEERLQKILSQWGVASRRQAEQLILAGRVRVNGEVVQQLGQKADPTCDRIEVDGRQMTSLSRPEPLYLLLNKPLGVVSTCADPWGRPTVLHLLPEKLRQDNGLHPVGRLDANSTGALLLTNDGDLTYALTHPSHQVPKTYRVWVEGHPSPQVLHQWRKGVMLDDRLTLPAQVEVVAQKADRTCLEVVLQEGRNRQIRRVATQLGHPVLALHRIAIGPIVLNGLPTGKVRSLTQEEVNFLKTQRCTPVPKMTSN